MFAVLSRSLAGDVSRVVRKGGNNDLEVKKYRRRRVHRDENDASDSRRRFHVIADAVGRGGRREKSPSSSSQMGAAKRDTQIEKLGLSMDELEMYNQETAGYKSIINAALEILLETCPPFIPEGTESDVEQFKDEDIESFLSLIHI